MLFACYPTCEIVLVFSLVLNNNVWQKFLTYYILIRLSFVFTLFRMPIVNNLIQLFVSNSFELK